jgi:hypothetical protein
MANTEPKTTNTPIEDKAIEEPKTVETKESTESPPCRVYDREIGCQDYDRIFAQGRIGRRDSLRVSDRGVVQGG